MGLEILHVCCVLISEDFGVRTGAGQGPFWLRGNTSGALEKRIVGVFEWIVVLD